MVVLDYAFMQKIMQKSKLSNRFQVNYLILSRADGFPDKHIFISTNRDHSPLSLKALLAEIPLYHFLQCFRTYSRNHTAFPEQCCSDLVFRSGFSLMRWVCCSVSHKEVIGWWHVYHFPQKNLQQVTKYAKHFILWAQKEWCNHHLSHIPGELVTVCIDCETQLSSESSAVFIPDNRTLATY